MGAAPSRRRMIRLHRPYPAALGALMAVLALLAGCAPAAVAPPPGPPGPGRLQGTACLDALPQRGIAYQIVSERAVNGCNLAGAVRVGRLEAPFDKPAEMTCELALKLDEFETAVVQPPALRYFNPRVIPVPPPRRYALPHATPPP